MADTIAPIERTTVTLHVTSPCEHGIKHDILELHANAHFGVRECVDSHGRPRSHHVTAEKYPQTVRRR